ncbi:MAG: dethiobiotin synthase [Desulfonatronovibrionaceae bacterium]
MHVDCSKRIFITGTDTGVGKTVVAGMLAAAGAGCYWKPIQTGSDLETDSAWVKRVCGVPRQRIYPETYSFPEPVSPHLAAKWAGQRIDPLKVNWPESSEQVIAEGAGGIMVPLNEKEFMLDLIVRLAAPVLVVARSGLGTINHTLLTVNRLRLSGVDVLGVVLNGKPNPENKKAVEKYGGTNVVAEIDVLSELTPEKILSAGERHFSGLRFCCCDMGLL